MTRIVKLWSDQAHRTRAYRHARYRVLNDDGDTLGEVESRHTPEFMGRRSNGRNWRTFVYWIAETPDGRRVGDNDFETRREAIDALVEGMAPRS